MSEFIGSRISLISRSDIRYVGVLHEINSETSTVALESVQSFGTEGRRSNPAEEIPPSDSIYDYIVFRGGDVKDLRIEEAPKENKPAPQVPNDPAILGSGSRPPPSGGPPQGPQGGHMNQPPPYQQQHHFNQYQQQGFGGAYGGPGGPPTGRGFPGYPGAPPMGGPPGWYNGPYGQQYGGGPPPPFPPGQQPPFGPLGSHQGHQRGPSQPGPQEAPVNGNANGSKPAAEMAAPAQKRPSNSNSKNVTPAPAGSHAPPPPVESKPAPSEALANTSNPSLPSSQGPAPSQPAIAAKSNKIVPVVPLPAAKGPAKSGPAAQPPSVATNQPGILRPPHMAGSNATTQAATAAVQAAMAKIGNIQNQKPVPAPNPVDNLTQKVNEMRVDHQTRPARGGHERGRGRGRGRGGQARGIEVPKQDFDFETANAQFDKDQLVKDAMGPATDADGAADARESGTPTGKDIVIPGVTGYTSSSFFDNLSSDAKDREDDRSGLRPSGQEFRTEERKRNMETFGLSNVDGSHRGGYRGRGRGRGFRGGRGPRGGQGRGFSGRGGSPAGAPAFA